VTEREALAILRGADAAAAARAEAQLWEMWCRAGEPEIDALFARGVAAMEQGRFPDAEGIFTAIIVRAPDFAEGWNKRATLYFLIGEYDKSLKDCDEVVKRNPAHFGALSGYGQIYLRLGQPDKALPYFERALAVNPNLDQVAVVIRELREAASRRRRDSI
jgi:tetratricopeptide (TPR) repeat protein